MLRFGYNINEPLNTANCLTDEKHAIRGCLKPKLTYSKRTLTIGFGIAIPEVALEATQDLNRIREASSLPIFLRFCPLPRYNVLTFYRPDVMSLLGGQMYVMQLEIFVFL